MLHPAQEGVGRSAGQLSEGPPGTNPKRRPCPPDFGPGAETMFADAFPYLVTTAASHPQTASVLAPVPIAA